MGYTPTIWVLLGSRPGDDSQSLIIADALGIPYETKQLVFKLADQHGRHLSYASLKTLDLEKTSPLQPPWPDLVIATGRTHIPPALWIKRQSGGKTKLVHLNRPQADLSQFDLVLAMPQFRMPRLPNVMRLRWPLMRPRVPVDAGHYLNGWRQAWQDLPRPWTVVLVGGPVIPYRFDSSMARHLLSALANEHKTVGGSYILISSPRTPAEVDQILSSAASSFCRSYLWSERKNNAQNPYSAALKLGDRFIVTGDSVSMLTESVRTGKPAFIYPLPPEKSVMQGLRRAVAQWLHDMDKMDRQPWRQAIAVWLHKTGIFPFSRDFDLYHHILIKNRLAALFGGTAPQPGSVMEDELPLVVGRINDLLRSGQ